MLTFYQCLGFLLPPIFTLLKGYFLSAEFSLYPYLISQGFLPYKNILDQHFPSLFFGQFSLPYFMVDHPTKLLFLLLGLNFFTTLFLQKILIREKVPQYQFWILIYGLLSIFFSVNTLWIETFVIFFLSLSLYLNYRKNFLLHIFIGLLFSQMLLMRPTIIFFLSTLYLILVRKKIPVFAGFLVGTFLSLLYLIKNSLFGNFWNLAIVFNQSVYSHVQNQPINKRQIVSLGLLVAIFCFSQIQKNKLSATFLGLSSLVLVYPRFGLEHLQVFLFTFILLLSQANLSSLVKILTFSLAAVISLISWLSIFSAQYGNFFYPREIFDVAKKIKNLPGDTVYLYGASDLLYQLSGKTPTGKIYLPSLPWYLNHPSFQEKLFGALAANPGYVIVDPLFSVDNQKLITTTPQILSYIKMNYLLVDHIGQLEVYKPKYENRN